jgi:oligosaccharide repeat unit polymerase
MAVNIIILQIVLALLLALFIVIFKKKLTSISLWATGVLLLSATFYSLNQRYFGKDISFDTILIVSGCVICFFIGEVLSSCIPIFKINVKKRSETYKNIIYDPRNGFIITSTAFLLAIAFFKLHDMYRFASTHGFSGYIGLIYYMRDYVTTGAYGNKTLLSLFLTFSDSVAYVFVYYFLHNLILHKSKNTKLLIPILIYIVIMGTETGRTAFIKFFIIVLGILYVLMKKRGNYRVEKKFIKYAIVIIAAMLAFFYFYGEIFRKSTRTLSEYSANYYSAGLYGLNYYIENGWVKNDQFGQYTLSNIYYYLNKYGGEYIIPAQHLPFFSWANGRSNIYTAFVLPMQDYGVLGLFLTRILIAFIYTFIERRLIIMEGKKSYISVVLCIVFGEFLYICFSIPIADRFKELLTVTTFPSFVIGLIIFNAMFISSCSKRMGEELIA